MKNEHLTSHPIRHTFANNLRKIRRLKDISQEALAFDAELSRAYISDVERGKRAISIDAMGKIADALNVNLVDLLKTDYSVDNLLQK
ncbi:helix-turn-helix domain-containing protein [Glaesserella parasuis]|uniref:helix-turn-helix domain-containing protein n=1 Tax=Glaesserella parasuis TaxID=738 RepID=UPI0011ED7820|nr:helix-turn-helix transcriptional regulator [Glaesserella parasuis]MDO9758954.1 helix-turn-helix transcriptional regulator [Glaesserella parasuis]QEM87368.1 helix-turn-helix transcriptional regulator [Glaesserella parasuis]